MAILPIPATPLPNMLPPMPPSAVPPATQVGKSPQGEKGGSSQQNLFAKDEHETSALLENIGETGKQTVLQDRQAITARSGYELPENAGKLSEIATTEAAAPLPEQIAAETAAGGGNLTTTVFSATGKLIDQLLQMARQQGAMPALQGSKPILETAPASLSSTPEIAKALQSTVELSGLFYESHIGETIQNERALSELLQEPQARQPTASDSAAAKPSEPLNATLTQLVAQQLNTLEQNRIVWQGQIWPGQQMYWEVKEDTSGQHSQTQTEDENTSRVWRSDMQFEMPHLGKIQASVFYSNGQVQVQINAADETAASAMRAQALRLAGALDDAGTRLDAMSVRTDAGK
ncbi:flagellar hook-length control protein FliK [Candidatus Methylospira mobilis]|uniref:Flagellar hook-length control protein FliK n=1 Tax=Candidatus Methylospira mobilis TaxID=1808979 RepID=A0A5Q0BIB8_9GAMM|nr:flagellar hook-length control protein FliK [Candidatus Methylospira mobilis]QFY41878.1 flagellar hook-length control protein FliK [Candidatus Methylospira mobilis]WNV06756.1 flagellar hook-length control protein FliK [Candidatus Methylospira mobilis]